VRFEILAVTIIKMAVFWGVAPCILLDTDRCFRGAYCPIIITLMRDDNVVKIRAGTFQSFLSIITEYYLFA
jgi:hypothetical protein